MANSIAGRLKFARIKAGFSSAAEFANKYSISYITYSQHESGKRNLSPELILKYADHTNVDASWLLTGQEPNINKKEGGLQLSDNVDNNLPPIDANSLWDIYSEINKLIMELNLNVAEKFKFILCVEIYQLTNSNKFGFSNNCKYDVLKLLLTRIDEYKVEKIA